MKKGYLANVFCTSTSPSNLALNLMLGDPNLGGIDAWETVGFVENRLSIISHPAPGIA
jgi:hypothetical protein